MTRPRAAGLVAALVVALALLAWWTAEQDQPGRVPAAAPEGVARRVEPRPRPPPAPAPAVEVPEVEAGAAEVRCEVGRALEGRTCELALQGSSPDLRFVPFTYDGATVSFTAVEGIERAVVVCGRGGDQPVVATLALGDDGSCSVVGELPLPADAPVFGVVRGAADLPEGTVFLEGCGVSSDVPVDAEGGFFHQGAAGRCRMRAWRQAGALRVPGPWAEVELVSGHEVEAALSVPTWEPAGMGIGFQPTGEGVTVTMVREGTPAASAGLEGGDLILAIDGVPTAGMDIDAFLQHGIGPAGSEVHLEGTTADGEPFDVTIERQRIAGPG